MIFAHDAPRLLAVLDWELSTLGHPFADLAYQCMQWRLPNAGEFRGLAGRRPRRARPSRRRGLCRRLLPARGACRSPGLAVPHRLQLLPHRRDRAGRLQALARRQRLQPRTRAQDGRRRAADGAAGDGGGGGGGVNESLLLQRGRRWPTKSAGRGCFPVTLRPKNPRTTPLPQADEGGAARRCGMRRPNRGAP